MKILSLIFLVFSLVLIADDDNEYYEHSLHIPRDLSYLDLSDTQKDLIKNIIKNNNKKLLQIYEDEEDFEKDAKKMFLNENFDKQSYIKESTKLKNKIITLEADFFNNIHHILNKKQRELFLIHLEEWEID